MLRLAGKLFLLVSGVLLSFSTIKSHSCGMAWGRDDAPASMVGEKTLIIWDQEKKYQHFIRQAQFESSSELGFIVPVPSVPEVADFKGSPFRGLDDEMEAQRPKIYKFLPDFSSGDRVGAVGGMDGASRSKGGLPGAVQLMASYELQNYQVSVLKADELKPLEDWLNANAFDLRPALKEWLSYYLRAESFFTVFKFKKNSSRSPFESQAVRISFSTPEPFYPYRDASDSPGTLGRRLNLYFLAQTQFVPDFLNRTDLEKADGWDSRPIFSNHIDIPKNLEAFSASKNQWLTLWQDNTSIRPNRDLSFVARAETQTEKILLSPKTVDLSAYVILGGLLLFLVLCVFGIYKIFKRIFRKK